MACDVTVEGMDGTVINIDGTIEDTDGDDTYIKLLKGDRERLHEEGKICMEDKDEDGYEFAFCTKLVLGETTIHGTVYNVELCESKAEA